MPPTPPTSVEAVAAQGIGPDWLERRVILTYKNKAQEAEELLCVPKGMFFCDAVRAGAQEWLMFVYDLHTRVERVVPVRHIINWRPAGAA